MRWTVGKKLVGSFMVVLVLTTLIGVVGISTGATIASHAKEIATNWMPKSVLLEKMNTSISNYRLYEVQYIISAMRNDQESMDSYLEKQKNELKSLEDSQAKVEELIILETGRQYLHEFQAQWKDFVATNEKLIAVAQAGDPQKAITIQSKEATTSYNEAHAALLKFSNFTQSQSDRVLAEADASYYANRNILIGALIVAVVLGLGVAIYISQGISKAVVLISQMANRMAEGDLTVKTLDIKSGDEIGEMGQAFNHMLQNWQTFIRQTTSSAQQVAGASEELSATAEENSAVAQQISKAIDGLAKGQTEQTRIVGESVSIMEQLAKSINDIAAGAQEQAKNTTITSERASMVTKRVQEVVTRTEGVKAAAEQNLSSAQNGGIAVNKSIEGLKRIQSAVTDSAGKISELGK